MKNFSIQGNNTMGTDTEIVVEAGAWGKNGETVFHMGTWVIGGTGGCFIQLTPKQARKLAKKIIKWTDEQV